MIKALAKAYGKEEKEVMRRFKELGDLGDVAEEFAKNSKSQIQNLKQIQNYKFKESKQKSSEF